MHQCLYCIVRPFHNYGNCSRCTIEGLFFKKIFTYIINIIVDLTTYNKENELKTHYEYQEKIVAKHTVYKRCI